MRDVTPRSLAPISILLPMLLAACGQGDTESAADAAGDPVEHYTSLISRLENGEIETLGLDRLVQDTADHYAPQVKA